MVFSSFPVYLDHPNLLQLQQPELHQPNPGLLDNPHQLQTPPPPGQAGSGSGSIRPGSMVDRARLAKIPLPEAGLKCPRCDSSNTKFCYFNNYNLSQPRHFCKTCRRYWTRGGALRSVPVGGGCRRNKKSKNNNNNNRSKSAERSQLMGGTTSTTAPTSTTSPSSCSTDITGHHSFTHSSSSGQLTPLMAAFQNLNYYGGFHPSHHQLGVSHDQMGFQIRSNNSNTNDLQENQWKLPSFEQQPTNLYQFQSDQGSVDHQEMSHGNISSTPLEKIAENNNDALNNSTKQFLGSLENNQYCGGNNTWTGFAGLNSSSSTGHFL